MKHIIYPDKRGGPTNPHGIEVQGSVINTADPKIEWQWEININVKSFSDAAIPQLIESLKEVEKRINESKASTEPKRKKYPILFMRGVSIEICRDGVMTIRTSEDQPKRLDSALPVYSVETKEQAEILIATYCKRQYNGDMRYTDFSGEIEDMYPLTKLFAETDERFRQNSEDYASKE